jgi:hypothetical protein
MLYKLIEMKKIKQIRRKMAAIDSISMALPDEKPLISVW